MTALQWIVKEAKAQKNKYPTKFKTWKEYIKQASKQYNTGIKPSFAKNYVGAVKKSVPKKKAMKKAIKKAVPKKKIVKKAAPKKVAKKKLTPRDYDLRFQADKPGKRTSASGNTYYEYRGNRSDRGKLLGIGKVYTGFRKNIFVDYKYEIDKIEYYTGFLEDEKYKVKNYKEFNYTINDINNGKKKIKEWTEIIKELKTHARELKKFL